MTQPLPVGSWRKDNTNIVVTSSRKFFDLTKLATIIAVELHIKTRAERVALFHAVRAGQITTAKEWFDYTDMAGDTI